MALLDRLSDESAQFHLLLYPQRKLQMDQQIRLTTNRADGLTSIAKSFVGAAPFVGPTLAEIVGHIIPNQRMDRIAEFVRLLDERVKGLEQEAMQARMQQPDNVDLLEDAFIQAARATSHERLEHIANIVANGISAEELNYAETKRMLWLLNQLNDAEVVILRGKLAICREEIEQDAEFRGKHERLLTPDLTHLGSSEEEFEEAALKASYRNHLHDLGLTRSRFKRPRSGELPEFDDKTGMMKANGADITRLGKMLLRYLNLIPSWYQR